MLAGSSLRPLPRALAFIIFLETLCHFPVLLSQFVLTGIKVLIVVHVVFRTTEMALYQTAYFFCVNLLALGAAKVIR